MGTAAEVEHADREHGFSELWARMGVSLGSLVGVVGIVLTAFATVSMSLGAHLCRA